MRTSKHLGSIRESYASVIDCLERQEVGLWTSRVFQVWLSAARGLTRAQRREALAVLSGRSEGEASKAAIELGVDEARRCPHCASEGAVSRGMARGVHGGGNMYRGGGAKMYHGLGGSLSA